MHDHILERAIDARHADLVRQANTGSRPKPRSGLVPVSAGRFTRVYMTRSARRLDPVRAVKEV